MKHREILIIPHTDKWNELIELNRKNSKRLKPWTMGCAHQCSMFHPGILFKEIAVHRYEKSRKKANISCDVYIPESKYFKFPDSGIYGEIKFIEDKNSLSYCTISALSKEKLKKIINDVKANTQAERYFKTTLILRPQSENLAVLITRTKESFLDEYGFSLPQVYLSELLKTGMYGEFYEKIRKSKNEFIKIYNRSLKEIPYPSGVKNLSHGELPFWKQKGIEAAVPKVIPLTVFLRLYIFDLYIEGIGGSHYQPAADFVIKNFFKEEPPVTAAASATLWYPERLETVDEKIKKKHYIIRRMEKNPQEFTKDEKAVRELGELIDNLRKVDNKSKIHQQLLKKKEEIKEEIRGSIQKEKKELERLKQTNSMISREYPFFVYPEEDIRYLFEVEI